MNLRKGSSHDWDLLAENKGLIVGDSENPVLVLQKFSPYPITIEILPIEGRIRARIYYRELRQFMIFEIPLGLHREMEIPLLWSLGILRKQGLDLEIPLTRIVTQVLEIVMPLKIKPIKLEIAVSDTGRVRYGIEWKGEFGRTRKETVKTLKALLKLLREGN